MQGFPQVWRTVADEQQYAMLRPELRLLPPQFRHSRAFHLGVHPSRPPLELLHELQAVLARSPEGASGLHMVGFYEQGLGLEHASHFLK